MNGFASRDSGRNGCIGSTENDLEKVRMRTWKTSNPRLPSIVRVSSATLTQLPRDVPRNEIDGEQVGDGVQPPVAIEASEVGVGHARAQLLDAFLGHLAFGHKVWVAPEDRLGEELAARDLKGYPERNLGN